MFRIAICVTLVAAMAACTPPPKKGGKAKQLPERPAAGSTTETLSLAEQGCLRDVTSTTNNPDVVLLRSSFSEAGTEVIVGVGPKKAPWSCIGYSDGTTAGITSLTDEGSL